jgi:hypothetical protein
LVLVSLEFSLYIRMNYYMEYIQIIHIKIVGDRSGRDRMVVGSTTTYVLSVYHHKGCEFESRS